MRTANEALSFTIAGTSGALTLSFGVFLLRFGPFGTAGLNAETGNDLLDIRTGTLSGYDLVSSFGPETQSPPDFLNPG